MKIKENKKMNEKEMQNKIEQLEKELNELRKKMTEPERWEHYKDGYYIDTNGIIYEVEGLGYGYPAPHNCFRTRELAELRAKQREAEDELFNIWEHLVGDWRPDWGNKSPKHYMIITNYEKDKIWIYKYFEYSFEYSDTALNDPVLPLYRYFPTQKLAQKQYELASDHARAYIRGEF
jgi:hypothetical protein